MEDEGAYTSSAMEDEKEELTDSSAMEDEGDLAPLLWSPAVVLKVVVLFFLAGVAEIGGGWLVWKAVREDKPWWWAVVGCVVLASYGFIPTLQPIDDFGRLYAVYGGVFIGMSFAWGRIFDGVQVDMGDAIGSAIAFVGIVVVLFWPRQG